MHGPGSIASAIVILQCDVPVHRVFYCKINDVFILVLSMKMIDKVTDCHQH